MSDDGMAPTRGGSVAHARPLTRRQQRQQKSQPTAPPKARPKGQPAPQVSAQPAPQARPQPKSPTAPPSRAQAKQVGARRARLEPVAVPPTATPPPASATQATQAPPTRRGAPRAKAASAAAYPPPPSAHMSRPTAASAAQGAPATSARSVDPAPLEPAGRKHPTLAVMTSLVGATPPTVSPPVSPTPTASRDGANVSLAIIVTESVSDAPATQFPATGRETSRQTMSLAAPTADLTSAAHAATVANPIDTTAETIPSETTHPTEPPIANSTAAPRITGFPRAPRQPAPRSPVETRPIAALEIMRRLPVRDPLADDATQPLASGAGVVDGQGAPGKPTRHDEPAGDRDGARVGAPAPVWDGALVGNQADEWEVDLEAEGSPTLPTVAIPLRTYSRPLIGRGARQRSQGLLGRYGRAGIAGPRPLPQVNLVLPVAAIHALVATVAALAAAALAVMTPTAALWALALALISGVGAGLGYTAGQRRAYAWGALWLLLSQLGMLGWALAALGPRPALVALAVGSVALALRTRGRTTAAYALIGALTLYAASLVGAFTGLWRPAITLGALPLALLDATCIGLTLLMTLGALAGWSASRTRAEAAAQASQHEALFIRRGAAATRERMEEDADRLVMALGAALQGRGLPTPVAAEGPLHPLAEAINLAAERFATLQRDREDRLRLEGALNGVIKAVERAWLGLSWAWPHPSSTPLDDLVALLRAPRPQDVLASSASVPSGVYAADAALDDDGDDDDPFAESASARSERGSQLSHSWPPLRQRAAPDGASASPAPLGDSPSWPDVAPIDLQAPGSVEEAERSPYARFAQFDTTAAFASPDWASEPESWPGQVADPWPASWPDDDDPEDSASRRLTPPPTHRRWNEWSSQPGGRRAGGREQDDSAAWPPAERATDRGERGE